MTIPLNGFNKSSYMTCFWHFSTKSTWSSFTRILTCICYLQRVFLAFSRNWTFWKTIHNFLHSSTHFNLLLVVSMQNIQPTNISILYDNIRQHKWFKVFAILLQHDPSHSNIFLHYTMKTYNILKQYYIDVLSNMHTNCTNLNYE